MKKSILFIALAILLFSCKKDTPRLEVSFSFTKESFEIGEPIGITNTTIIENDEPSMWLWSWEGGSKYGKNFGNTLSFDKVGDYEITLEVKTNTGLSGKYSANAHVTNNNILPVANFSWSPSSGVKIGDSIAFTDLSSDEDGEIVAWEWQFGGETSTERNPVFTALEVGETSVTLTVTDNHYGKASKTASIQISAVTGAMQLVWSCTYDTNPKAFVYWNSPAMSPDGSKVYAISSGYKLAAIGATSGVVEWTSDLASRGAIANIIPEDSNTNTITSTPSVDSDGNIYAMVGFCPTAMGEAESCDNPSSIWSISASGAENWYLECPTTRFRCTSPVIVGGFLAIHADKSTTKFGNNLFFLNKNTGAQTGVSGLANGPTRDMGSIIAIRTSSSDPDVEYMLIVGQNAANGSRVYYPKGTGIPGEWAQFTGSHAADDDACYSLGWHYLDANKTTRTSTNELARSGQMCASQDGSIYALYDNYSGQLDGRVATAQYGSILYGYGNLENLVERVDTVIADRGNLHVPNFARNMKGRVECKWYCGIKGGVWNGHDGNNNGRGTGPVMSPDGSVLFVTSSDITSGPTGAQEAHVTAVNVSTGTVIWEHEALGNICGVCAVDSDGYVYYCDYALAGKGALVKLDPANGKVLERIALGTSLRCSPTIAADGSIYVNGMTEEGPTLFKVKSSATSYATGVWSQLCGGPRKAGSIHD